MKSMTSLGIAFAIAFGSAIASAQTIVREDVSADGFQARPGAASCSWDLSISGDGRWIAFCSAGDNLVANSGSGCSVFVKDTTNGAVELASVSSAGVSFGGINAAPSCSVDANWIAFTSNSQGAFEQIMLRDRSAGTTLCISTDSGGAPADLDCFQPKISPDGRFVVYTSRASNLVAGDTNGVGDIFLYDRSNGSTQRVSVDANGLQLDGPSEDPSLTPDGRFVAFATTSAILAANDSNGAYDVYRRDLQTGAVLLVSVDPSGLAGNGASTSPSLSADGSVVVFKSSATNLAAGTTIGGLVDVFVRDLNTQSTTCLSLDASGHAVGGAQSVEISRDGRWVSFASDGLDALPNGWPDVFLFDRTNNARIELTNPMPNGQASDGPSGGGIFDDAAQRVVFQSDATALVGGDRAGADTYRWEFAPSTPTVNYCTGKVNSNGCAPAIYSNGEPSLSSEFYIGAVDVAWNGTGAGYPGLMIYSVAGRTSIPFGGGTLCVAAPIRRAPATFSLSYKFSWNGPCKAAIAINMSAFSLGHAGGHPIPELVQIGTTVDCQWWLRDAAGGAQLSNALEYVVAP